MYNHFKIISHAQKLLRVTPWYGIISLRETKRISPIRKNHRRNSFYEKRKKRKFQTNSFRGFGSYDHVRRYSGSISGGDMIITDAATEAGYSYEDGDGNPKVVKISTGTQVTKYKQYALALADLQAGRIDAILMDKLPAQTMLKTMAD